MTTSSSKCAIDSGDEPWAKKQNSMIAVIQFVGDFAKNGVPTKKHSQKDAENALSRLLWHEKNVGFM